MQMGLGILYFYLLNLTALFPEMANWRRGWVRAQTVDRERALETGFRGAVGLSTLLKVRVIRLWFEGQMP